MKSNKLISKKRLQRLKDQGYCNISDSDLSKLGFGNRFAFIICTTIVITGVITSNIPILLAMMTIAFFGVFLPYHPFDYVYNHVIVKMTDKPKLPKRSKQLKFACTIATLWIATVIFLFYSGYTLSGYVMGGLLCIVAGLVSTIDLCIPSIIYNYIFKVKNVE